MTPADWPTGKFGAILADPPWRFEVWSGQTPVKKRGSTTTFVAAQVHYDTLDTNRLCELPVADLSEDDCALFLWTTWPLMEHGLRVINSWGFTYKTCGFAWFKGDALPMFPDDMRDQMGLGYWTRANSEVCLLATRGKPKRLNADVRQAILEPRREHSRKPSCVYERIERLVAGPYLELFARTTRPGWTSWGNEVGKFKT